MSTVYHSAVVIGCKISKSKVFFVEQIRSCDHSIDESAKFCPECGKKVLKEKKGSIEQYDPWSKTVCGLSTFFDERDDFIIIAGEFAETDYYSEPEMLSVGAVQKASRILRRLLGPCNLWDKKEFGIYVIQWCSR